LLFNQDFVLAEQRACFFVKTSPQSGHSLLRFVLVNWTHRRAFFGWPLGGAAVAPGATLATATPPGCYRSWPQLAARVATAETGTCSWARYRPQSADLLRLTRAPAAVTLNALRRRAAWPSRLALVIWPLSYDHSQTLVRTSYPATGGGAVGSSLSADEKKRLVTAGRRAGTAAPVRFNGVHHFP
jgi:hypothetical protein